MRQSLVCLLILGFMTGAVATAEAKNSLTR
jgi:hypothetical protein